MFKFRKLVWILVVLLVGFNIYRSFQKNWTYGDPMDFRGLYVQTLLFQENKPIYSDEVAREKWQELKIEEQFESSTDLGEEYYTILLYPPQTPAMFFFLKDLSWRQVRTFWWFVCTISFVIVLLLLYQQQRDPLIIGLALSAKASFFALSLGQPLLPVLALVLLAIYIHERQEIVAGILLGLALLKFTIVVPVAFWFLFRKRFKTLLAMACTGIALLIPVVYHNPEIISQFFQKVADYYILLFTPHELNIYTTSDSELAIFLDYYLKKGPDFWNVINGAAQIIGFISLGILYLKNRIASDHLLALFILLTFVFSYHLSYDALYLLLPLSFVSIKKRLYNIGILWFLILSLPINALVKAITGGSEPGILMFNYPILVLMAFVALIFAGIERKSTDIIS